MRDGFGKMIVRMCDEIMNNLSNNIIYSPSSTGRVASSSTGRVYSSSIGFLITKGRWALLPQIILSIHLLEH
jgi:hypothetical protein